MPSHSRHLRRVTTAAATLATLLAVIASTGCSSSPANDPSKSDAQSAAQTASEPDSLMLVVSVHANVSAPDVPVELASTLETAIRAELPIAVIAVDGDPAVSWSSGDYEITDANPAASDADVQSVTGAVITAVRGTVADSNGSDVMQGIRVARDKATANGSTHPLIVVIDSGLSDTGSIDFTVPGLTLAEPTEVSAQLTDVLPELSGSSVLLVGFGYAVAPQRPLSPRQTETVAAVWTAALTDAGASVSLLPVPRSDAGPDTAFTTRTVEPSIAPAVEVTAPEPAVFDEASSLSFLPGTAEFRDPGAAATTLADIASALASAPDRSVHIMGTTAGTDTIESQIALATSRANAVRDGLVGLGVDPTRIDAVGVGTQWDGYVYDVLPDGTLDPGTAALNRTVRISFPLS
jgi:outer membrane protein OmpA-like peptidoglycan-associated protein